MKVELRQHKWNELVKFGLERIKPVVGIEILKEHIKKGDIYVYGIYANEICVGFIFSRIDRNYDQEEELVIMYSVSLVKSDVKLTRILSPLYDQIANGRRIRIHSERRGHDKLLEQHGYKFFESVFIKEANHEQIKQ